MAYGDHYGWRPYRPVAARRRQAAKKIAALKKKGQRVHPVSIAGRKIALTFWGKAWCDNLESYSDYENRLPRGRTYVRNDSVIDLQIEPRRVKALVSGSSVYEVGIAIKPAGKDRWQALANQCAGQIDSVVELLQGKLSKGVMEILACRDTGLFPSPRQIAFECSCPDWASMCKHVAAALYGVGARLDHAPEMLFVLRDVDHMDLVAQAGSGALGEISGGTEEQDLDASDLSDIFGIDLEEEEPPSRPPAAKPKRTGSRVHTSSNRKPSAKKKRASGNKQASTRGTQSRVPSGSDTRGLEGKSKKFSQEITARELIELGVPRSTFQNWVSSGVLVRTGQRGIYLKTATTEERINKALETLRR